MDFSQPDTKTVELELSTIQARSVQVTDQLSHDSAVEGIRQASYFIKKVESFFEPFEKPLRQALEGLRSRKKNLIDPADQYITDNRKKCAAWQADEIKRLKEERARQLEEINNAAPWEEVNVPAPVPVTLSGNSGAVIRNKPWQARVVNEDALWEAAVKDPRYRAFFTIDTKALNAKARSQQAAFNVPGCEAFQEQTLVVKG